MSSDVNESVWNRFLSELGKSNYPSRYFTPHGLLEKSPSSFEEIQGLRNRDPVRLEIRPDDGMSLNCHFFCSSEIELDLDPKEVRDSERFEILAQFMRWMASAVQRDVILAHESAKELQILKVEANAV